MLGALARSASRRAHYATEPGAESAPGSVGSTYEARLLETELDDLAGLDLVDVDRCAGDVAIRRELDLLGQTLVVDLVKFRDDVLAGDRLLGLDEGNHRLDQRVGRVVGLR